MSGAAVAGFGEEFGKELGEERAWGDAALWHRAHEALVRLAATRAGLDYEEGQWLLRAERSGVHLRLGYASFREYVARLFGYSPRLVQEKLRVADALEELPVLSAELESGRMSFSAVRELTRVATAATERAWLEAARGRSIREIEGLVSGQKPGSLPEDAPDADAKRHVLRLEVSGEGLATFREAMAKMRREAGEAMLDDDAAVLLLCRRALEGPRDDGRASYQVALTVCEHCRRGMQQGRGELVEVSAEIIEMAECDGQNIGHVEETAHAHVGETTHAHVGETTHAHMGETTHAHVGETARAHVGETARAHVGETARAHVGETTHARVGETGHVHVGETRHAHVGETRHAHVGEARHAHVGETRHAHVGHAHVGETAYAHVGASLPRATQAIPPALRRRVKRRDGGRCRVPGCRHAVFVDVHHLEPRAEGGRNTLENLVTLCSAHHRAIHRGRLVVEASPSGGLAFRHSNGTPYGALPALHSAEFFAKAFRALTLMGYRETEVKRALARVPESSIVSLEQLIRLALRELGAGSLASQRLGRRGGCRQGDMATPPASA